jgi:hypothetical protein
MVEGRKKGGEAGQAAREETMAQTRGTVLRPLRQPESDAWGEQ